MLEKDLFMIGAGVAPAILSVSLRTLVMGLATFWALSQVLGVVHALQHAPTGVSIPACISTLCQTLALLSGFVVLVML